MNVLVSQSVFRATSIHIYSYLYVFQSNLLEREDIEKSFQVNLVLYLYMLSLMKNLNRVDKSEDLGRVSRQLFEQNCSKTVIRQEIFRKHI